ncbi:uncharacterized protein LOC144166778 [Haemaphysalis longicornis]
MAKMSWRYHPYGNFSRSRRNARRHINPPQYTRNTGSGHSLLVQYSSVAYWTYLGADRSVISVSWQYWVVQQGHQPDVPSILQGHVLGQPPQQFPLINIAEELRRLSNFLADISFRPNYEQQNQYF